MVPAAPLLGLLLVILSPSAAYGWTTYLRDKLNGICAWNAYAPRCPIPSECSGAPVPQPAVQRSPIDFGNVTRLRKSPTMCFSRQFPFVLPAELPVGTPTTTAPTRRLNSSMRLEVNGGGVVVARCIQSSPIFMQLRRCFDADRDSDAPAELFPVDEMYEVIEVQFFNGLMNNWPATGGYPSVGGRDMDILFHRSVKREETNDGQDVYGIGCRRHYQQLLPPDLILTVSIMEGLVTSVYPSVITRLLDTLGYARMAFVRGTTTRIELSAKLNLSPGTVGTETPVLGYVGSVVHPPCWWGVPRLVLPASLIVPTDVLRTIADLSEGKQTGFADITQPLLPGTEIYAGRLKLEEVGGSVSVDDEVPTPTSVAPPIFLFNPVLLQILTLLNVFLILQLALLLLARWEWLEIPTMLGGLNYRLQFYAPAYADMAERAAQSIDARARMALPGEEVVDTPTPQGGSLSTSGGVERLTESDASYATLSLPSIMLSDTVYSTSRY